MGPPAAKGGDFTRDNLRARWSCSAPLTIGIENDLAGNYYYGGP